VEIRDKKQKNPNKSDIAKVMESIICVASIHFNIYLQMNGFQG